MQHALQKHGYNLSLLQLRNLRLHPTVRILLQNRANLSKEQVSSIADKAVAAALQSGQSLRWGAGAYTIANVRMQGVLVSE